MTQQIDKGGMGGLGPLTESLKNAKPEELVECLSGVPPATLKKLENGIARGLRRQSGVAMSGKSGQGIAPLANKSQAKGNAKSGPRKTAKVKVDHSLRSLERLGRQVQQADDTSQLEKDIEKHVEDLQSSIDGVMNKFDGGEQGALADVFGGDCARAGRTRAVLEGCTNANSDVVRAQRQCMRSLEKIEKALASTGSAKTLKVSQEKEMKAFLERTEVNSEGESEDWGESDEGDTVHVPPGMVLVPDDFCGQLCKKNPGRKMTFLGFNQWQVRFVVLSEGKMRWYESRQHWQDKKGMKGEIDFCLNACSVEDVPDSETRFTIRPEGGKWVLGGFTGAEDGREFVWDSKFDSEAPGPLKDRDAWMFAIGNHLKHGGKSFAGTRPNFLN